VLVIDSDEWLARVLVHSLEQRGYSVELCSEARAGFKKACESRFDCIVCSPELTDIDGTWVARRIRTEPGPVAKTPFLFVGEIADKDERIQGVHAGADVFLKRPISNEEVVAQVDALIAFARRMSGLGAGEEGPASSSARSAAIRGDLSMFPLASVLMMLEMERRSGLVEIVGSSGRRATLTLTEGLFASTAIGGEGKPALDVLREVLSWRAGRFAYIARESPTTGTPRASVGALVLEAMRLEDEKKAAP
jgi:two-component system, OmpR family, response regulator